jgi:hypothetical protein
MLSICIFYFIFYDIRFVLKNFDKPQFPAGVRTNKKNGARSPSGWMGSSADSLVRGGHI